MDYQASYLLGSLIAVMFFSTIYYSIKIIIARKKAREETKEAALVLAERFKKLRQEIREQTQKLKKKKVLSLEENINYKKMKEALDSSEKYINKEIKDILKALK